MSRKKAAMLAIKLGFCVIALAAVGTANSFFLPCPRGCLPAGGFHCICP